MTNLPPTLGYPSAFSFPEMLEEEALSAYDKALSLKSDHAVVYNNRGATKSLIGQLEAAIADYDKAIQFKPDYADAYYNRGWARSELNQYEAAIADYDETIRLNLQSCRFILQSRHC